MALRAVDVIGGARIDGHPNVYVLGCYDSRITFYSQQVRALELAHALFHQHHVSGHARIAVVGGGAGGTMIAAALALQSDANVFLYERSDVLMPLQRESMRRRLDPHIYDWPRQDADHELAELPMLDWKSGPAVEVREAVLREFNEVRAVVGDKLTVHLSHDVTAVAPTPNGFSVNFTRDGLNGDREMAQSEVEIVVFAFGYGVEPARGMANTNTESYWSDAGVPGPLINGKAQPVFFVSGNGDGGLIDCVAAASAQFDHHATIRSIVKRRGVRALAERLQAIDLQARAADQAGNGFDFIAAYDADIRADVVNMGLIDEVAALLRPGVQLYFQTREPELMSIRTATLNRLAVYLVIKACQRGDGRHFEHVVCANVVSHDPPAGFNQPAFLLDCDGRWIAADRVIVRRGPGREAVRAPFEQVLLGYEEAHKRWIAMFPQDSIAPALSDEARDHFVRLARAKYLPMSRYRQTEMEGQLPSRIKLSLRDNNARWSGDIALPAAIQAWGPQAPLLLLNIEGRPDDLGPLSFAAARLGIHSTRCTFHLDVPQWQPFMKRLSSSSLHAEDIALPALQAMGGNVSILNVTNGEPGAIAAALNRAMDVWVLDAINSHLQAYLTHGDDPGRFVGFKAANDLRDAMQAAWTVWIQSFSASPSALAHFLRLIVCAQEGGDNEFEAQSLVGPRRLKFLVRATAVALAVATAWEIMAPNGMVPGNLIYTTAGGVRTGHACAAELIEGELTAISAARFIWKTHFVVLPMINSPIGVSLLADASLISTPSKVPRLNEVDDGANLILTLDSAFLNAASNGLAAMRTLLLAAEDNHFKRLKATIELTNVDGGAV